MRERASSIEANLTIKSHPGEGTKVRLELPLHSNQEQLVDTVRVLLVEDHVAVREALAASFDGEVGFEVAGQAASLAEARRLLEGIDVAVVDLGLPDGFGADLIRELRELNPHAQALVLSASLDRGEIARAVESGAAGILNKTVHLDEVVEAVRRLSAGDTLMPFTEVVELLRHAGVVKEREEETRKTLSRLTSRENEVLQALTLGLDSQGVADHLRISLRTERNHISSILAKLGVHSQLQALVLALRSGIVKINAEPPERS
jgi:DNA-binding NarL/FixJ family response regulator